MTDLRQRRLTIEVDPRDDGEVFSKVFTGVSPYHAASTWVDDQRRKTGQRYRIRSAYYSWPRAE